MQGYSPPFRRDRSNHAGGLLLFIRDDIPSKLLKQFEGDSEFETIMVEIRLYQTKWLIGACYNPHKRNIDKFLEKLSTALAEYCSQYENLILLGDFNSEMTANAMNAFCMSFNFKSLISLPTCFKNIDNPTCIDLILTNKPRCFKNSTTIETGLSDFHKLVISVLNTTYKKEKPKVITYRDYKRYNNLALRDAISCYFTWEELKLMSNDEFTSTFMNFFDTFAPLKQRYVRANDNPFVTKELRKAFMKRARLKNNYLKFKDDTSYSAYKKHRNFCKNLVVKSKKSYYENLKPSSISDVRKFWRTVKPLFSDKAMKNVNITLVESEKIINEPTEIANEFSSLLSSAVSTLQIRDLYPKFSNSENDPILSAIYRFKNHPSIIRIVELYPTPQSFSFKYIDITDIFEAILSLNNSKAAPTNNIPVRILKENIDLFTCKLHNDLNIAIETGTFPRNLKKADITPSHKKGCRTDKNNYRPISILPPISKLFEKLLLCQIDNYFSDKLSPLLCGFRKNYNTQMCLLSMIEKWKRTLDKSGSAGAVLTDLSKAFDCLNYDLLIAKLNCYGMDMKSLRLVYSYLTDRFQRVRINSSYSSWSDILTGVPQGSILGPILFNIYINDFFLFFSHQNIANYADDNTPFACEKDIPTVLNKLQEDSTSMMRYLEDNYLKGNPDKFHLLLSKTDKNKFHLNIENNIIENSDTQKLLGITIDNELKFDIHVANLCKKASQKLHALARISKYMSLRQRRIIMKSFINSQFGYCPIVWMFHSRTLNRRINNIHERSLRIVYEDYKSSFEELLQKDNTVTVHERNIQTLAVEVFKVKIGMAPKIMEDIFQLKERDLYQTKFPFKSHNVRTTYYGTETATFLGPKIYNILPSYLKEIDNLYEFKRLIKTWKPTKCPCRLCIPYVEGVGFTNIINI